MKIAFFHGLESPAISDKTEYLEGTYSDVYAPAMDYTKAGLFSDMLKEVKERNIDLLVGSSMGGWFAYCISTLTGIPTLLFNPAVHSRSMEPEVKRGSTKANHVVILGKSDKLIDPYKTKDWFKTSGVGRFTFHMESNSHRTPIGIFKKWMSSINESVNEEWSTESPGVGATISIIPEGMRDFVSPNFLASRPTPGFGLTVENEEELPIVIAAQKHLSNEDNQFIKSAAENPADIFYKWLVVRGEFPKFGEINSIWKSESSLSLINQMKDEYKRARPYWISSEVKAVDGTELSCYSFPSGHAILSWMIAKKLSQKYPHLTQGLESLADRIAQSRVQCGVHFPSDIKPAKGMAECMIKAGY